MLAYQLVQAEEKINVARHATAHGVHVPNEILLPVEFKIERYADDEADAPYSVTRDGSACALLGLLTNLGGDRLWKALNDGITGAELFSASNSHLAVGSDSTAAAATQTALVNQTGNRKAMDTDWPKINGDSGFSTVRAMQWKATFGSSDGNSDWREFGIFNHATGSNNSPPGAIMLDRFVSSQGTKVSGQIWVLTVTVTLT